MRSYRLYTLSPFSGQIADTREFAAQNHETAVWIAEGFRHSRPMELWCGRTRIQMWEMIAEQPIDEATEEDMQVLHQPIVSH